MAEAISGQRSYYGAAGVRASAASETKESDEPINTGGILGYVLDGDQDTRAPEAKPENKQGMVGGLASGFMNGLKGTIKGLFSVEGLAMTAAFIGLTAVTGGALTPVLVALGLGVGGYQVAKGASTGDWEQAGRGLFSLGSTALGAKYDFKVTKSAKTGNEYAMALGATQKSGFQAASQVRPSLMDSVKLTLGKKMTSAQGDHKNIYQLAGSNLKANVKSWFA